MTSTIKRLGLFILAIIVFVLGMIFEPFTPFGEIAALAIAAKAVA